jgi:hypothetical protein
LEVFQSPRLSLSQKRLFDDTFKQEG